MFEQQKPLTAEVIFKMFRKVKAMIQDVSEQQKETAEQQKETAEQQKKTEKLIKEVAEQQKKTDEQMKKTDEQIKKTNRVIGNLGSRIGEIIENMVAGNIVDKFQALGYEDIDTCYENRKYSNKKLGIDGEIDLILENGDVAIIIEVKTTLETADVHRTIGQLEKFRRYIDAKGGDKRRFIGAVAGAVIKGKAKDVAHENGLYVIVQSGEAVDVIIPPEGFVAKEW